MCSFIKAFINGSLKIILCEFDSCCDGVWIVVGVLVITIVIICFMSLSEDVENNEKKDNPNEQFIKGTNIDCNYTNIHITNNYSVQCQQSDNKNSQSKKTP